MQYEVKKLIEDCNDKQGASTGPIPDVAEKASERLKPEEMLSLDKSKKKKDKEETAADQKKVSN